MLFRSFINVYRNGALLGSADYTATNGTTVVLASAATSGDLVTVESFLVSSVLNAIPATAGSVGSTYLASSLTLNGTTTFAGGVANAYGFGVGTAVPSSGAGVSFPATQSSSSDANTLDDYEESTWTPTYTSGSGSGLVVTTNYAAYTKIGRAVTLNLKFTITTVSTASGVVNISGLPFAAATDGSAMIFREMANTGTAFCAALSSTTSLQMARYDGATPIVLNNAYLGCMTYFI